MFEINAKNLKNLLGHLASKVDADGEGNFIVTVSRQGDSESFIRTLPLVMKCGHKDLARESALIVRISGAIAGNALEDKDHIPRLEGLDFANTRLQRFDENLRCELMYARNGAPDGYVVWKFAPDRLSKIGPQVARILGCDPALLQDLPPPFPALTQVWVPDAVILSAGKPARDEPMQANRAQLTRRAPNSMDR